MQEEQRGQELVLNQISDMKKHIEEVEKLFTLSDFHSCYSCCDCNVSKLERDAGRTAGTRAGIKSDQ